ncbi:hypothetical protein AGOR_G00056480 [Albula goreensis]|uniref:Uncharacterized protein n=1 Tax=Albula goreensis TaxID=1534307 RepID=A0A8T3DVG0_9TELE|nr:hypothetical protein AGOR_G00056480 [Albula goreensis]
MRGVEGQRVNRDRRTDAQTDGPSSDDPPPARLCRGWGASSGTTTVGRPRKTRLEREDANICSLRKTRGQQQKEM